MPFIESLNMDFDGDFIPKEIAKMPKDEKIKSLKNDISILRCIKLADEITNKIKKIKMKGCFKNV